MYLAGVRQNSSRARHRANRETRERFLRRPNTAELLYLAANVPYITRDIASRTGGYIATRWISRASMRAI